MGRALRETQRSRAQCWVSRRTRSNLRSKLHHSQACARRLHEAHVDDLLVLHVGLEDAGLAHDRAGRGPGLLADHAVLAPHLVGERAVERGLEVLDRHGGELLLGDLGGFGRIGVEELQPLHHALDEALHRLGILLDGVEAHVDGGVGIGPELLRHVEERLAPQSAADALGDHRLGYHADGGLSALDGGWHRRVGHLDQGHIALGVELPLRQQVAHDRVGRAAVRADRDVLALEVGRPILVLGIMAFEGIDVDVAAVDAMHHGAQLGTLGLGKGVVLRPADEGEGLAREHRVGVAGAGLDGHDLHRKV